MSANITNQVAYLKTSRNFPYDDIRELTVELNKSYLDIANAVNNRIISIFTVNVSAINGEDWFIVANRRQQGFRKVFAFTSTAAINHGIANVPGGMFIRCFGSYTDAAGINTYGLIFGTNSATTIPGQISFYVSATQIVFEVDGAAPVLASGTIVLEWLSRP